MKFLQTLQEQDEKESAKLLKLLAPPKGKAKSGAKISLADELKLTAEQPVSAADIALFGRMTTSEAFQDVEAACQVADGISTHPVDIETDYFTTVDDLDVATGAALKAIAAEAPQIACKAIEGLLRAIMHNVPSGKINSHAHNQHPSLILVEVKPQKVATNYLTAFHDPARAGQRRSESSPQTVRSRRPPPPKKSKPSSRRVSFWLMPASS